MEERAQTHETGIGEVRKDIANLRADLGDLRVELRTSVAELRTEIRTNGAELRTEIAGVRGDMVHRSDLADFRRDMNTRFVAMDQKFTWLVGSLVAGLVAVIGALAGSYYQ